MPTPNLGVSVCVSVTEAQAQESRDKKIPGGLIVCLTETVSFRFSERPCLKIKIGPRHVKTPYVNL